MAVDGNGNVYVTGTTSGVDFPQVGGGTATTAGGKDAFVVKLDPSGHLFASVLLGGSQDDVGTAIVLGADGGLYLTGTTLSSDFPTTPGAYRSTQPPGIGFVVKLNPSLLSGNKLNQGSIIYATSSIGGGPLAVDRSGNVYLTGPTGYLGYMGVAKLDSSGSTLKYSTPFGAGTEMVGGLAVDATGSAYVSGTTSSANLPTTANAFQPRWTPKSGPTPSTTGFVVKFSPDGSTVTYATYLGGTGADRAHGIAVDSAGNAYVAGETISPDFPVRNAIQAGLENTIRGVFSVSGTINGEAYYASAGTLAVLNPSGTDLVWSTFLGWGAALGVTLDPAGNVYVTGSDIVLTGSTLASNGSNSVGVVKIAPQGNPLQFSGDALVSSASFHPGLPHPGGLGTLFVHGLKVSGMIVPSTSPLPTELAGVSIIVDGTPAPILTIADLGQSSGLDTEQINFQVPFEVPDLPIGSPQPAHLVEVRYGSISTYAAPQTVGPGIFVLPDGSPAIQHSADYSLVSAAKPAAEGEVIIIYATGLGRVNSGPATGMPATGAAPIQNRCMPATVNIGDILYAGLTPGFVGLYQLNVRVSQTAPSGLADLRITFVQCWDWTSFAFPPDNYQLSNTVKVPIQ